MSARRRSPRPRRASLRPLIESAKRARKRAYCPYSRYPVGAAVRGESGRIYAGANVENASYGLSLCAERVAIFNAVSHGEKGLRAAAVVGTAARPCGACRQVMLEFSSKDAVLALVHLDAAARKERVTLTNIASMLPSPFDPLASGLLPPNPQNLLRRRMPARKHARPAHRHRASVKQGG